MKRIRAGSIILLLLSAWYLSGCQWDGAASGEPDYPTEIAEDDWEAELKYREDNMADEAFLNGQKTFTFKTAQALFENREENLIYSPVGLYYALALTASGAVKETEEELCDFLGCETSESAVLNAGKLYRTLYKDNDIGKLHIATSMWVDEKLELKAKFKKNAAEQLYASLHSVDFKESDTKQEMEKWVQKHTNGTILPEIQFAPQQVMSVLNTVYLGDQWQSRFDRELTKPAVFYTVEGGEREVDFMNARFGSFGFVKGRNYTRSELSLKETGSMVFLLPDEGTSVEELMSSPETLQEALEGGDSQMGEVTFQIPKFAMDSKFDIKGMLENMGVTKIFSGGDFSAMAKGELFVSSIDQNGHIAINEEGVEASAFTEIAYCGAAIPTGKAEMILNRPFIYGIRNHGVWLFIGVCDNPAPEKN